MKKIIIILFFQCISLIAQSNIRYLDTSYTVYSTYQKEVQKFPFIKIVGPILSTNIKIDKNIEYVNYRERKLSLDVFYSTSNSVLRTGVILVHGGGWRSYNKSHKFPLAA